MFKSLKKNSGEATWKRKNRREYLPLVSRDTEGLKKFAADRKLDKNSSSNQSSAVWLNFIRPHMDTVRKYMKAFNAETSIWSIFLAVLAIGLI